jgi:hypothetical protein
MVVAYSEAKLANLEGILNFLQILQGQFLKFVKIVSIPSVISIFQYKKVLTVHPSRVLRELSHP